MPVEVERRRGGPAGVAGGEGPLARHHQRQAGRQADRLLGAGEVEVGPPGRHLEALAGGGADAVEHGEGAGLAGQAAEGLGIDPHAGRGVHVGGEQGLEGAASREGLAGPPPGAGASPTGAATSATSAP